MRVQRGACDITMWGFTMGNHEPRERELPLQQSGIEKGLKGCKMVTSRDWHMGKDGTRERLGHLHNLNVHSFYKKKRYKMKKNSEIIT